jgi:hypothetical protein
VAPAPLRPGGPPAFPPQSSSHGTQPGSLVDRDSKPTWDHAVNFPLSHPSP